MKRTITLLAFCLFTALTAYAQVTFKPGVRAGVNISKITQTEFDAKTDFYIGGLGALKLTRFYTMQPEITYSRQGSEANFRYIDPLSGLYVNNTADIEISYLSFALMNKFTFNDQFNIHFGPTLDFQTSSNVATNSDVDTGIMAGLGYTFPFGLTLEARVKKGFVDVLETDYYNTSNYYVDDYNTNFVFQVGVSYNFNVTGSTK